MRWRANLISVIVGVAALVLGPGSADQGRYSGAGDPLLSEAFAQGFPGSGGTATATPAPTWTPGPTVSCAGVYGVGRPDSATRAGAKQVPTLAANGADRARRAQGSLNRSARPSARATAHGVPYQPPASRASAAAGPSADWTVITCETFEGVDFADWDSFDNDGVTNGEYCWDTVGYQARYGLYSAWPAAACRDGVSPATHFYPNQADSWMVYGPFSLADAEDADVHFSLWHQIAREGAGGNDLLFFGASVDSINYEGSFITGNSTNLEPPTTTGWRDIVFDLKDVPTLGNLLGQPLVWMAWNFSSGQDGVDDGPFIDDVLIHKKVGSSTVPTHTAPQPAGSTTPTPTRTVTPTATSSRTATNTLAATPTPLPGGRALSLSVGTGGVNLTWEPRTGQSGYVVVRISPQGSTLLPAGGLLPASATSFTDSAPPPGPACYVLLPVQEPPQTLVGSSEVLCLLAQTRSGAGAPESFTLRLNESNVATLTWQAPPGSSQTGYVLLPLGRAPIPLGANTTSATDVMAGPTCYLLVAHTAGVIQGNTDILCGIPRAT